MTTVSLRGRPGGFSTGSGRIGVLVRIKRVLAYRRILELLIRRDLQVRYAGSALGYLWTVFDPLLMSLVYWFIFTKIVHRQIGFPPYMLFLVLGQILWAWFSGGVQSTAKALRSEAQMVRSSNVPRELWVVRVVASKGVEYVLSLPVVVIFALAYRKTPHIEVLFLPLAMIMCFFLVLGVGLILAPITVLIRDVNRVIPIMIRLLFYTSGVLYSTTDVPHRLSFILSYNPIVGILVLARSTFFPQELDGDIVSTVRKNGHKQTVVHHINHWEYVWHSALGIAVLLVIGVYVFSRLERQVLKEI
jgi:ABC-2 type transport system permease protein